MDDIKASDWQVAGLGGINVAEGIGAGIWLFKFKSEDAGYAKPDFTFAFVAVSAGVSLDLTKLFKLAGKLKALVQVASAVSASPVSYSPITVHKPFGLKDLDFTPGVLVTAGYGVDLLGMDGYAVTYIGARPYFNREPVSGCQLAMGAGATSNLGLWIRIV